MPSLEDKRSPTLRVLMMPDYRADNPYQTLLARALTAQNVSVHFPAGYRRGLPIFRALQQNQQSFDILHLHWPNPYLKGDNVGLKLIYVLKFLLDLALVRLSGTKIVWTIHNRIGHEAKFPRLELWSQRGLTRLVNRIILHNQATAEALAQEFGFNLAKAQVIPIGHYRNVYHPLIDAPSARRALNLPDADRVYLYLGMVRPYKGLDQLIKLWQANQALFSQATLLIAGKAEDPLYTKQLKQMAETASPTIRIIPEFVPDEQIHLYYSAADVAVMPFTQILNSSSVILAMSYGKPVIAPRLGGIPETIGSADNLLYCPEDKEGLLKALVKSTKIDLRALSQAVTQECDRLDWDHIGGKTAQLYQMSASEGNVCHEMQTFMRPD